jgi:hypothetical protein
MRRIGIGIAVLAGVIGAVAVSVKANDIEVVRIEDRCDKATFPPEAGCVTSGGVTFSELLARVNPHDGGHGAWRFHGTDHIDWGQPLRIKNTGGEPHSFTEVSQYGTGILPILNPALPPGTPPAVPIGFGSLEEATGATLVLPGADKVVTALSVGQHKFQCLIHPWMQLTVEVRNKH